MSALDLFASALGAFILISIVLFPFFPRTGSYSDDARKAKEQLREAMRQLDDANAELAKTKADLKDAMGEVGEARKEIGNARNKALDLVIVLDVTRSMGHAIAGIQNDLDTLVRVLGGAFSDVSVGIVAYGDITYAGKHPVHGSNPTRGVTIESGLLPIGKGHPNLPKLQDFLGGLSAGMGLGSADTNRDPEEAVGLALDRAIHATAWRDQSQQRVIVVIGDNPAYPSEVQAALALTREFAAARAGNRISTVYVEVDVAQRAPNAKEFMADLARAGRGQMINGSRSLLADIVESAFR